MANKIVIPAKLKPSPQAKEIAAAHLLADYFDADVKFIPRSNHKTPDFLIGSVRWELKTPTGNGKHNIQHCIQDASEQSQNIIIDGRRSKLHANKLLHEVQYQFNLVKKAKRLLLIKKSGSIVEIFRKK